MFYGGVQPAKNGSNSAFFTGTGAVLRRSAIDSIGGFAAEPATEDIHTSIRLHARGWRSVYLPTPLAYGLEVDNLREFYRTRRRWAGRTPGSPPRSPRSRSARCGVTTRYGRGHFHPLYGEVFGMAASIPMFAAMRGLVRVERGDDRQALYGYVSSRAASAPVAA